ncbi:hypothetical protein [Stutzerimonas nosocomialis]|uniref:hypothetical protein n=1 Tax=Stutzerimonas nosocomialis TaxID=1056496 RepID=UPI001F4FCF8D|nr:hypothetical protein [Stutzerimonas nosocomialis]
MNGSASVSVSQSKLKSDFNSVQEQTGLFAGKGGYQLDVQGHTQLDGSVIASTAAPEANRLETDTLGWTDIRNKAEFSAQQQSAGFSTGGAIGQQFAGNMANTLLVGANRSESESSTTYSAVSDGAIVIRNQAEQQQDVANLSRDVEHANNALSPIFDKEKEQRRLREIQLIGEIGNQTMDIIARMGRSKRPRRRVKRWRRKATSVQAPKRSPEATPTRRKWANTAPAATCSVPLKR